MRLAPADVAVQLSPPAVPAHLAVKAPNWQSKQSYTALPPQAKYIVPASASQLSLNPAASAAPARSGQVALPMAGGPAMHPASTAHTASSA